VRPSPNPYAGIATRAVALVVDIAIADLIVLMAAAVVALVSSLVGGLHPRWLVAILSAVGWLAIVGTYFVGSWTAAGQTPGMRLMHLRVLGPDGGRVPTWRAVVRLVGLGLAIIPFFAGFLTVLVDARRRALQDFLAGTVVVYADLATASAREPAPAPREAPAPLPGDAQPT
jgi:uncharacterized RDD family membrane protein YckC